MMSTIDNGYGAGDGGYPRTGSGVGADLRAARERLGWTLPGISEKLRIRLPFLQAIEDGRISELPGNAYAVGFLRTYAGAVGLDPDEISRRFRAEAAHVNRKTELAFPAPVPERGVPAGAVVLLGVVVVVMAYVGWYRLSGDRRPAVEQVQPLPDRLAPLAASPTTPAPPVGAGSQNAQRPPALPSNIPAPILVPVPPVPTSTTPAAPAPVLAADGTRIVVRAKGEAWVQVADKQGNVVFNRTMRAGETWSVPAKQALFLTVGNAGGTELLVDGIVAPSLGADGVVRRNLPLDPDQVRDGKLTVAPPTPVAPAIKPPVPRQP